MLLVGLLVWAVFFSPLLALKSITIRNSGPKVSESAIQAVLDPFIGTPLPRLSTSDMQRAVESLTAVESVSVARSWPHSATVSVTGREAVAVEKLEDGQYQLLDAYGIALGVRSEIPEGVPVLDLSGPEHLREPQVDDVLTVLGALPGDVRERLTTAQVDADGLMSFTLENGARVVWGSATDTELKARVLEVLLSQEAKVYDVSAPRTPVTR